MRRFLLSLLALAWLALPAEAVLDKDCGFTQGSTTVQTGFNNCDEELVELYERAPQTATGVSGTNDISLIFSPTIGGTPTTGTNIIFTAVATSTGTVRIITDGGSPLNAANESGANLGTGDITNGQTYLATFDGTKWRVIVRGGAGGGGAPTTADYLTLSNNGSLTAERAFTPGTGLGAVDGGADSTYTLNITDVELTSILALTSAADRLPYYTGLGTASLATFTAFGRSIVDDADATAFWATITGDEFAQDAVGTILTDGTFIDFTYTDAGPTIAATIIAGSLTATELGADSVAASELANNAVDTAAIVDDAVTYAKIQNISVTDRILGRDTAGAGDIEELTVSGGLEFTGTGIQRSALSGDVAAPAGSNTTTIQPDSVALTTDTTGNFIDAVLAGTGLAVTHTPGEGSDATVAFDYSDAGVDPALGPDECRFTNDDSVPGNIVCEGGTANSSEHRIAFTALTGTDRVMTVPDADSNPVRPLTCSGTDKVSAVAATGVITCSTDEGGAGSGDNIRVEDGDDAATFTAATDADFDDSEDINFSINTAATPDAITATVRANSVALTTDTTGNYVATITAGTGISGSSAAEGGTPTIAFDFSDAGADPALSADQCRFTSNATASGFIVCEGDTADTFESRVFFTDPTADRLFTIPDAASFPITDKDYGDITVSASGQTWAVDADTIALTTDTTGNYVATITAGTGITGSSSSEGGTPTIALSYADQGADPALGADQCVFTSNATVGGYIVCEGDTADTFETRIVVTDPTADRTFTIPNANSVGLTDADKGDITVGSAGTDFQIDTDAVTATEIAANSVAISEMADDAVGIDELDLIDGDTPANGDCLTYDTGVGGTIEAITCPGAGGGDSITVNTVAVVDPDFDDATPAAPAGAKNVTWQTATNDISAHVTAASTTAIGVSELATTTEVLTGTDTTRTVTPDALAAVWEKGSAVASAATISLGDGYFFHITGTTTITDIDFATATDGRCAILEFDAAVTLTHNATTLVLPTGANMTSEAGSMALVCQDSGDNIHLVFSENFAETAIQDIALLAGAGTIPTANGCTAVSAFDSGTNDVFLKQCSFSASTDQSIYWTVPVPADADETIALTARVDWTSATGTDASDDVIWGMSCVAFSNDDPINVAFGANDTVTDTQTAAGDFLSSPTITTITPAGTWAENDMLVCRLQRDADAAGDNFNGTAELINVQLFVTVED